MYAQLTNGLLLDYQLNGNFLDSSPNGYNGTGFNGTFANDNMGNPQGALAANGNNTYVEFPNVPELKPDFPITMAVRVRFDYLDGTQIIAATDFGVNTHSGAWLQVSSQDKITASYGNAGGGFNGSSRHGKQANFNLQSYTWYSIVAIFRGYQDIDIYIDCELQEGFYTGNAQTIGYTDAAGSLCRKRGSPESTTPPYYLSGDIDYFMYWDRELTPEEIVPICEDCPGELSAMDNQECVGGIVGYTFSLFAPASDIIEALWTFADGSVSYNWLSYKTYDSVGTYPFTLQVTTENGCVFETSGITVIIEIPDNPVLPNSISICQGDSYFLDLSDFSDWDQILDSNGNPVTSYSFDEPGIFNFEFIHACGQVEVSVEVFQTNITGYLTYVGENPICENSVVAFEINEWEDIQDSVTFFLNFGNGNGEIVSNASMSNLYSNAGTYLIELSGTISNCEVDESLTLNVEAPLDFELDSLYDICQGAVVSINFDDYNFPVFDSNGSEIEIFNSDSSGTYVFSAQNACGLVSEQIEIEVTPFQPNPFAQEILICPVTDTLIIGFGSNSYMYSWNTGQNTPIITVNSGGNYSVTVIDSSGFCSNNYIFNVAETPLILDSIFNVPEIEFCMEGNTVLTPNNLGFPYTFPDGSIDTSYDVKVPGTITVNYSDGCYEYQESIEIAIENCLCPLIVPNIFTPNGDGKNEVFKTSYNCETPIFYMSVFNRWGQLIFESSDIDIGWNGQIIDNQNESSEGVYFYQIEYAQYVDDLPHYKTLKGNVTLMR